MAVPSCMELKIQIRSLIAKGWIQTPNTRKYRGTGGPGKVLEDELNVDGGNDDLPESNR